MKINVNQILPEGLVLEEYLKPQELEIETEAVKFKGPLKVEGRIYKITNAVSAELSLSGTLLLDCSRCLSEFQAAFKKNLKLNYAVGKSDFVIDGSTSLTINPERSRWIDLGPGIRQEIIIDYPIKPLCNPNCKGLCPKCGKNLNEGGCSCAIT